MLKYPELYKTSQNALDFNTKVGKKSNIIKAEINRNSV